MIWRLVHKLPCRAVHALCSLCRESGICPRCAERIFATAEAATTTRPAQTFSVGSTYVRTFTSTVVR